MPGRSIEQSKSATTGAGVAAAGALEPHGPVPGRLPVDAGGGDDGLVAGTDGLLVAEEHPVSSASKMTGMNFTVLTIAF